MFLIRLLSRCPFWLLYGLSDFLFFVGYRVLGYRRKLVQKNLRNSFPNKTALELHHIEKEFYKNLCDYAVESLKLLSITKEELAKRMIFKNPELIEYYKSINQSIILLSSHQFNWEWLLVAGSFMLPVEIDFVYQSVSSNFFDEVMQQARTRFGAYPIQRDRVAREILKRKEKKRGIAIVADQYPGYGRDKKYHATFLNQETVFFYGCQHMAQLTQFPAIYAVITKVKRGYYECTLVTIGEPPYKKDSDNVVENYVRAVEKRIMEEPAGWLWSHNRWKKRHVAHQEETANQI
ncbi:MAG: lysophospholipid acyltransferase family protein [Chryseolinea sp.]